MRCADIRYHRHIRFCGKGTLAYFAKVVHAHLDYRRVITAVKPQQGERNTERVIEVSCGFEGCKFA